MPRAGMSCVVATDRPDCYVWFGTRVEIEHSTPRASRPGAGRGRSRCGRSSELIRFAAAGSLRRPRRALDADVPGARGRSARSSTRLQAGDLFMHKHEHAVAEPPQRQPQAVGVAAPASVSRRRQHVELGRARAAGRRSRAARRGAGDVRRAAPPARGTSPPSSWWKGSSSAAPGA